jgi:hypothetical protein
MLNELAHPMAVPFSTRRSAQAALLVLSLIGGKAAHPAAIEVEPSHLRVHLRGFSLWATRCDKPMLPRRQDRANPAVDSFPRFPTAAGWRSWIRMTKMSS